VLLEAVSHYKRRRSRARNLAFGGVSVATYAQPASPASLYSDVKQLKDSEPRSRGAIAPELLRV